MGTLHTHKCDNVVAGSTGVEEGVWQCEMCEKTFKNERYLARHKQLHGLPSFDCEHCGKKFIRKVSFAIGLIVHNGIDCSQDKINYCL